MNDLIERYIYAVTKRLPKKIRDDVSKELYSLISDMLDERCGDMSPTDKDIRVVLTELGTPGELSAQYAPDKDKCLIGAPYYQTYIVILKIVLICYTAGMLIANLIRFIFEEDVFIPSIIFETLSSIIMGAVFAFTIITILFAILYRKNIRIDSPHWSIDNLPPVPRKANRIAKSECIAGIIFEIGFAILFIAFPFVLGISKSNGQFITFFDTASIYSSWYFILAFALIGIIKETVKLFEGAYTITTTLVILADDIISGVIAVIWLKNTTIINPVLITEISDYIGSGNPEGVNLVSGLMENFNYVFLAIILFALTLESATTLIRYFRNKK